MLFFMLNEREKEIAKALRETGHKSRKVIGRGTLTVDPAEVRNTKKFKEFAERAAKLVTVNSGG